MSWDSNPYYSPEKFGLKILGMVEYKPNWDFDMFVVWESKDGLLYMGQDSGCSCPSPFEDIRGIEELERIGDYDQFARSLKEWASREDAISGGSTALGSLRRKVRRRLGGR